MAELQSPLLMSSELESPSELQTLKKQTPLPIFQLAIVYLMQFSEPITATVIYPFAPQFIRNTGITGGDETKTGYYAGIIESVFFITECLSVYHWAQASDYYGRRPILLLGPLGLTLAMLGFGLSKTFWSLVAFRCAQGVFNGNIGKAIGVSKTVIAEITDSTNRAEAFGYIPLMWCFGIIIGPLVGGSLSNPAVTWLNLFGKVSLFREYPYFLPCATAGLISFLAFLGGFFFLQETLTSRKKAAGESNTRSYGSTDTVTHEEAETEAEAPPSFMSLISDPRIQITMTCYGLLAFTDMSYGSLLPLVYSTSIPLGGLGLRPQQIGTIMALVGIFGALAQILVFSRLMRRFGPRRMFIAAIGTSFFTVAAFPAMSFFAKRAGKVDAAVISIMVLQLSCSTMAYVAYNSMQVLIVDSAPSKAALAVTNSLGQIVACCLRSMAPSVASSLFSVSLQYNLLGGRFVYAVILGTILVAFRVTFWLPKKMQMLD
ncbi:major facilitator superfamily domain-containing protein [Mycena floridula]|nr:major facilitator superfamily domain-containing protein [Mycena floridula]